MATVSQVKSCDVGKERTTVAVGTVTAACTWEADSLSEHGKAGSLEGRARQEIKGERDVYTGEHEAGKIVAVLVLSGSTVACRDLDIPHGLTELRVVCSLQTEKPNLKSIWVKSSLLLDKKPSTLN